MWCISSEEGVNWAVFYENFKTKLGRDGPVTGHGCLIMRVFTLHGWIHKQGLTELNTYPSGRKEGIECIMTFILKHPFSFHFFHGQDSSTSIFSRGGVTLQWIATTSCKSTWDAVPYFGINGLSMILCLCSPLHPLSKLVAIQDVPCSKLGGTTLNGREEGGQHYISQTCDQQRFQARKVVFWWKCLNIFATGCSGTHPCV